MNIADARESFLWECATWTPIAEELNAKFETHRSITGALQVRVAWNKDRTARSITVIHVQDLS